jgi:hypothetical protein
MTLAETASIAHFGNCRGRGIGRAADQRDETRVALQTAHETHELSAGLAAQPVISDHDIDLLVGEHGHGLVDILGCNHAANAQRAEHQADHFPHEAVIVEYENADVADALLHANPLWLAHT